jgi:hypothetical protein
VKNTDLNFADIRAAFARSWDVAESVWPEVEQAPVPTPPGFVAWRIVGTRACTVMPQLLPNAPFRVRHAYEARVISNLTGKCPICLQVASIDQSFCEAGTRSYSAALHRSGHAADLVTNNRASRLKGQPQDHRHALLKAYEVAVTIRR